MLFYPCYGLEEVSMSCLVVQTSQLVHEFGQSLPQYNCASLFQSLGFYVEHMLACYVGLVQKLPFTDTDHMIQVPHTNMHLRV